MSGEAGDEDVLIPYEPSASQQFIQEYNRMIAVEEELKQKLQQSEAQLRTMPQNMSSFHSTQGTIYTALWPKLFKWANFVIFNVAWSPLALTDSL